jgi:hypothetical protein
MIGNLQEMMKIQVENPLEPQTKKEADSSLNETSQDVNSSMAQSEPKKA